MYWSRRSRRRWIIIALWRWHRRLLEEFQPQVLHAHTAFLGGHAGACLARWRKLPLVLTEDTGPFSTIIRTPRQRAIVEAAVNAAHAVLPVSGAMQSAMLKALRVRSAERFQIVGRGYNRALFVPTPPPQTPPVRFLWIGTMTDVKQPLLLVNAFAAARASNPSFILSLMGAGPLEGSIRARISELGLNDIIKILPSGSRLQVAEALARHHALVISSQTETFGVVAAEALGSGRPVLSTRCGGPEEIIATTLGGCVVEGTAAALADGFAQLASRLHAFDAIALAECAASRYSDAVATRKLADTYDHVMQTKGQT